MKWFFLGVVILIFLSFSAWFFLSKESSNQTNREGPIVFLGDSITAGLGVEVGKAFPELLSERLGKQVINAGVSGDTTGTALRRLEIDVLSKNPSLVVIELGGNDFLQGININETTKNLEEIIKQIQIKGSTVLLLGIKVGLAADKDYETVGNFIKAKYKINFEPDIFSGIFSDPNLMSDQIHPNSSGHTLIANRLEPVIKKII